MSDRLTQLNRVLQEAASQQGGFLPFEAFMHHALYAPGLGYYAATQPVGTLAQGGDFTTAPQISSLFGSTLAQALAPAFEAGLACCILECGAGTGKLALDVLQRLEELGYNNVRYSILEVSASLRAQQQNTLASYSNVTWLEALPTAFEGVVLGNELLDAMPVQALLLKQTPQGASLFERGVVWQAQAQEQAQEQGSGGSWQWATRPIKEANQATLQNLLPSETQSQDDYQFELGTQAASWVSTMAERLQRGLILLVDYGFPRAELYHPQRAGGTLMAHHRHQASANVIANVGDADITAHVDFSAVAHAAQAAGLSVLGYTSQARFLINAGIANAYEAAVQGASALEQAKLARGLQYLISEAEMGELFKVIALGKGCPAPKGFESGDRSHRLAQSA